MRKVTIITFGKIKSKNYLELINHYSKLASKGINIQFKQLKDPGERKVAIDDFNYDGYLIALSEKGKGFTSEKFAQFLQDKIDFQSEISFVIGNAFGIDETVLSKANTVLSLSQMTLAHELSITVLMEQLFRAVDINTGGNYHK